MEEKKEPYGSDEKIVEIELERLRSFEKHPFKVTEDGQMMELQESIKKYGILNPLIVRPRPEGVYEIISGHRRKFAAEKIGYRKVPVIIRMLNDDEAVISMVDSNLQREMSYFCKLLHQECRVFIPQTTPEYYVNKMKINKAEINFVDGNYDECVEKANEYNGKENVSVILDTSKEGMHMSDIAENVINGYTTLFAEKGNQYYDYIFVPAGVGGVAAAAVKYNRCIGNSACKIICVEPINYNSLQKSLINGYLTQIKGSNTLMNGLKCGCPSEAAWQYIQSGVYGSISISDSECIIGKEELERKGINTGYTGASAYAGYKAFCHEEIEDLKVRRF